MADGDALARIEQKLDLLVKFMALQVAERHPSIMEKAVILRRLGLGPTSIADICGTTANTVTVALAKAKKKPKSRSRK